MGIFRVLLRWLAGRGPDVLLAAASGERSVRACERGGLPPLRERECERLVLREPSREPEGDWLPECESEAPSSRACDRAPALVRLWDFGLSSTRPDASLGLCRLTEAPLLRVPDVARLLWGPVAPMPESPGEACEDERPFRDALESMRSGR